MPQCVVFGCNNNVWKDKGSIGISFHRFPHNNPSLMKIWVASLRLKEPRITPSSRICSQHFSPECFVQDYSEESVGVKKGRRLKSDAVPTIFSFSRQSAPLRVSSQKRIERRDQSAIATSLIQPSSPSKCLESEKLALSIYQ